MLKNFSFFFLGFMEAMGITSSLTELHQELAIKMVRYWTNFTKYGSPNDISEPSSSTESFWPPFNIAEHNVMLLSELGPKAISNWGPRHCMDFWNAFYTEGVAGKDVSAISS